MRFFKPDRPISPVGALADLRNALRIRHAYQWWFLLAAAIVTGLILFGFYQDSAFKAPYKREIIYFENWRADRTLDEIIAQQKIDEPIRQKRLAEEKARAEKRRQEYKKIDDKLKELGI
ncbi:hypothetical protein FPZ54_15780 [Sphingomonas suaedae]|uniref:Uncharacterized protein n=1 Tax=Sphingomonas suaedae TaxID=2599297 RepID=A0A518RIM7_9SPHN|nr:hypothetical protein [Sphingomonas suaedae]QDX27318.1 hypothetical protein FPZ54_15780 [Sphingomonas suaedae]